LPARVRLAATDRGRDRNQALLIVTLQEGRSRQVRKMCDAIGHPVVRLRRTRIGPIGDPRLRPREFRELTAREVEALKRAAGLTDRRPSDLRGGDRRRARGR
jgi:16S rRNA U516 pseudouridylate synthase RsuA-like enzyme